jgi:hypothetical protein
MPIPSKVPKTYQPKPKAQPMIKPDANPRTEPKQPDKKS